MHFKARASGTYRSLGDQPRPRVGVLVSGQTRRILATRVAQPRATLAGMNYSSPKLQRAGRAFLLRLVAENGVEEAARVLRELADELEELDRKERTAMEAETSVPAPNERARARRDRSPVLGTTSPPSRCLSRCAENPCRSRPQSSGQGSRCYRGIEGPRPVRGSSLLAIGWSDPGQPWTQGR